MKCKANTSKIKTPFDIPTTWHWNKLKNVCIITNGFTPSRNNPFYWDSKDYAWMTVEDINKQGKYLTYTNQYISKLALKSSDRIVCENSTFICCTSATIGKIAINKIPMTSNQQFNGLTIKQFYPLLNEYLFIFCSTLKSDLIKIAGITTFPFVSIDKLGNILIPIPPYHEQIRIVNQLDKIFNFFE